MVYDATRNFLGDTYWKENHKLQEGEELTLDKGVIVEVAEAIGITQTDLTPLFEKNKESPQRRNAGPVQRPLQKPTLPANNALRAGSQLRHKSLNTLLGTPKGPIGKATPIISPFDARKEKENECAEVRPYKRQKMTHNAVESSPVTHRNPLPDHSLPVWTKPSGPGIVRTPKPLPQGATVICLDSEPDNISSDVTLPGTPLRTGQSVPRPTVTPVSVSNQALSNRSQKHATPKIPRGKVPVPHVKAQQTPRAPPPPSSPPISASNRLSNVDFAIEPAKPQPRKKPSIETAQPKPQKEPSPPQSPPRNPKTKSLRLSTGVRRGMLLCQTEPLRRVPNLGDPKHVSKSREKAPREILQESSVSILPDENSIQHVCPSKSMKATLGQKKRGLAPPASPPHERSPQPSIDSFDDMELIHGLMDEQPKVTPSPSASFDDMELIHGLMDQQLMPPPLPPQLQEPAKPKSPTIPKAPTVKPPVENGSSRKGKRAAEGSPAEEPKPKKTKPKTPRAKEVGNKSRGRKKGADTVQSAQGSPAPAPIRKPTEAVEDEFLDHSSLNPSVSISPKKPVLSTGGFRKRSKRAQAQPESPAPIPSTTALPPHPLRANKSGPLMNTTELSAQLQKSHKPTRVEDDPIEDGIQDASPSRSLQRSRSENDAPIPSTSEEWEQRNLPKASKPATDAVVADPIKEVEGPAPKPKPGGLAALVKKTDPRRKFQHTQSLNVNTNNLSVGDAEVVTPPADDDDDVGPWSTEAFDLFDWRPPPKEGEDQGIGLLVDKR